MGVKNCAYMSRLLDSVLMHVGGENNTHPTIKKKNIKFQIIINNNNNNNTNTKRTPRVLLTSQLEY